MLAEADAVYADLIGEHGLFNHIPDHLGMGEHFAVDAGLNVTEGVKGKFDLLHHQFVPSISVRRTRPGGICHSRVGHGLPVSAHLLQSIAAAPQTTGTANCGKIGYSSPLNARHAVNGCQKEQDFGDRYAQRGTE